MSTIIKYIFFELLVFCKQLLSRLDLINMSNWPVLNSELEYKFIDVSEDQNRRSEVWKYFWLDKKRAVARCKPCLDKGTSKILVVANGTTKSLQHHIDCCHKEKPNESKSSSVGQLSKTAHTFTKRKILGYHITNLFKEFPSVPFPAKPCANSCLY